MVVRILDHVETYSTYKDGEVIYRLIAEELRSDRPVTLSFSGIKSIPSAFVNAALIKLLEEFEFDVIRRRLTIIESTRQINRLIKDRFSFATGQASVVTGQSLPSDIQHIASRKLRMPNSARRLDDLRTPLANRLESVRGDRKGEYSIRINSQWRLCFRWTEAGASDVEIVDYD